MQPLPAPRLSLPKWQQNSLLPPSKVTVYLRVILVGPTSKASVSTTIYSGENLDTLEAISCQDVDFDGVVALSIDFIKDALDLQLRYISPF